MKKGVYFLTFALVFGLSVLTTACGGKKDDSAKADSLKKDSLRKDSIAKAEEKAKADAMAAADTTKKDSAATTEKKEDKKGH